MFLSAKKYHKALFISFFGICTPLFSAENIRLASNKIASFAQLINYQRQKLKLKEFDNTHLEALKDLFETVKNACLNVADIDKSSETVLFDNLDDVEKLTNKVVAQLNEMFGVYGQLMVYNQKTTSLKTRVKNVFRKKGTEISTTSTEDKEAIKKDLMETRKQLVTLVDECLNLTKQLKTTKTASEPTNYALKVLASYVEDALTAVVEYCISDVTLN